MWSWYIGRWWVDYYIQRGTATRGLGGLLAVPNATAHPSTASVPITVLLLYDGPLLCGFNVAIKGLRLTDETLTGCWITTRRTLQTAQETLPLSLDPTTCTTTTTHHHTCSFRPTCLLTSQALYLLLLHLPTTIITATSSSPSNHYTLCLKKTKPLRIIWHNFTNWQRLLIIFNRERPNSILNWYDKTFLNWFRTSCMVATATVATWRTRTANFWADFEQRVINRAINEWENNYVPVSRPKDCSSNTCHNFWHSTLFQYKHCLKDLTFLFIRQHQVWNDASLRIAMVTASAGTLL